MSDPTKQMKLTELRNELLAMRESLCLDLDSLDSAAALPEEGDEAILDGQALRVQIDLRLKDLGQALGQGQAKNPVISPTPQAAPSRDLPLWGIGLAIGLIIGAACIIGGLQTGSSQAPAPWLLDQALPTLHR